MSLVGTRPPTVDEWDKYELHHRARLATKPGLTGMWQVSGRSNITDFTELLLVNIISTTLAVVGFIGLVAANEGFSGQWALYAACGLILEILCGVIAYTAVNLVMKNTLIFEIVNKVKGKISHKA